MTTNVTEWIKIQNSSSASELQMNSSANSSKLGELIASSLLQSDTREMATEIVDNMVSSKVVYRDPLSVLITVTIIYSVILIVGLVGNIITCIVISRNKSMHTATNYYLYNLAITDMLLLVSAMPADLQRAWYPSQYPENGAVLCMLLTLLAEASSNASILTITCFTVERYIAICHPFRQQAMSKLSRAIKFIIGIWIAAIGTALPQACQYRVVHIGHEVLCTIRNPSLSYEYEISSLIFFVTPMILICVLYILIGLKLRQSSRVMGIFSHRPSQYISRNGSTSTGSNRNSSSNGSQKGKELPTSQHVAYGQIAPQSKTPKKSQRRIIKILVAVVVAFFLCWAPFHAQRLITVYGSNKEDNTPKNYTFYVVYTILTHVSGVTQFLSTCINPLLYSVMSYKFRSAFKTTIGSTCFKFDWKRRWSSRNTGSSKLTVSTTLQRNQTDNGQQEMLMAAAAAAAKKDLELKNLP